MPDDSSQDDMIARDQPPQINDLLALLNGPLDVRSLALSGLLLLAFFYTLFFARAVFLPIVLAILLNFLLSPLVRLLTKMYIPESIGAAVVLIAIFSTIGFGAYQLSDPATQWIAEAPERFRQIEWKLQSLKRSVREVSKTTEKIGELTNVGQDTNPSVVTVKAEGTKLSSLFVDTTLGFLSSCIVLFVLLYFLLASGDLFLLKLVRVLPNLHDKKLAVTIVRQVQTDISHYLATITVINAGLGVAVAGALYGLGMPNPVLWGVMAGALNFIPYIGAIVCTVILTFVALLSFDQVGQAALVPLVFMGLTALEGLLVTPTIIGQRMTLNPVVIFLWLTFWGWMWGIAGTLLAVPMLVALKICCDHMKPLGPIGEFLGS